jgi:serine/threonine-protein kinase RsbT
MFESMGMAMGDEGRELAVKLALRTEEDMVRVRAQVRQRAVELGFSLVEQTKIITAASEIARNTLRHGGGGEALVEVIVQPDRKGLRMQFRDNGPGIADVALAQRDGYSSAGGLGLGLGGARRLVDELELQTEVGVGTTITLMRWKQF